MARLSWASSIFLALASSQRAFGQSSSSNPADGLASTSASITATTSAIATATISGSPTTFSSQFTVPANAQNGAPVIPNIADPQAVNAQDVCPGYKASNVQHTATGFTASLSLAGAPCNVYGNDIEELMLTVDVQTAHRLSINISPAYITAENATQYILPDHLVYLPKQGVATSDTQDIDLQFSWSNDPSFSFTVLRKSTGDILVSTEGTVLVYEDQFIEFVTTLPEKYNLYGLGEHIHGLRLGNSYTSTFWAADVGDPIDTNLYGTHPFYLDTRYYEVDATTGNHTLVTGNVSTDAEYISYSHGVYLRNAHGMDVLMQPRNLTLRSLGGTIDLYVFDGPSQPEVTKQYQIGAIGLPAMQQYFTFGYHQCRWGYKNWTMLEDLVTNFENYGIPLETVWTDIDYMFQYRDFTNDPNTFAYDEGQAFLSRLHANGQHYVPIVDAAIYIPNPNNASDNYSVYTDGHSQDVFLKNPDGSEYIGDVWPGYTVFPDWLSSNAVSWWTSSMQSHHDNVPWDGIWIDMSEAASFCVGSCGSNNLSLNPVHPPFSLPGEPANIVWDYPESCNVTNATEAAAVSASSLASVSASPTPTAASSSISYLRTTPTPGSRNVNNPPYAINNVQGDLAVHAVSPNATHADGTEEYDVHSLFGHGILNATYNALSTIFPGKRPFIIGRSTFAGSGKWAGHWGGDNASRWAYMFFSIPQALSFSLFGIPMFGVDTCGFNGNSDEELCSRWMQMSAFFPFYRNHNTLSARSQEPYVWASVTEATKTAMTIRYSLLPYMYTLFYLSHTTGSTVMRALAWEFPHDPTLAAADRQFLLGPSLMITPVLEPLATTVNGVFPGIATGEVWYDWYTQSAIDAQAYENATINAPLGHIPVYIRGGSVLPQQEARMTTAQSRNSSWSLICALSTSGTATGMLYVDDGESIEPNATLIVDFTATGRKLYASARGEFVDTNGLGNVTVMGVSEGPGNVTLNGVEVPFGYNETSKVLSLKGLESETARGAWSSDWVLEW